MHATEMGQMTISRIKTNWKNTHSCGARCRSHATDQRTAQLRLPKELVYTNTGAQVDFENAPRVLYLAVI